MRDGEAVCRCSDKFRRATLDSDQKVGEPPDGSAAWHLQQAREGRHSCVAQRPPSPLVPSGRKRASDSPATNDGHLDKTVHTPVALCETGYVRLAFNPP